MIPGDRAQVRIIWAVGRRTTNRDWFGGYVVVKVREETVLVREIARGHLASYPRRDVRPDIRP